MNIERFHNEIAMRLGYERIVNERAISIRVVESENSPKVVIKIQNYPDEIEMSISDKMETIVSKVPFDLKNEIKYINEMLHFSYKEALKPF